jgi:chemotaxis protein methyltransferase CheR
MDDHQFYTILDRLHRSRRGYRKVRKGVKKRLTRHMQRLGCHTVSDYLRVIENSTDALQECEYLLTVSISRFFRDRRLWTIMNDTIIPHFIKTECEELTVWSAGCALGQEVYSFKILWSQMESIAEHPPRLFLWATDANPSYLERAKLGIYDETMLKGVAHDIRETYFHPMENGISLEVDTHLKKDIRWDVYDVVRQHLLQKQFDIIFLRNNLLTYYRREILEPAFCTILGCLAADGFLIIGSHEQLPFRVDDFMPVKGCTYIFQKT